MDLKAAVIIIFFRSFGIFGGTFVFIRFGPGIKASIKRRIRNRKSSRARLVAAGIDVTKLDIPRKATASEIERMLENGWGKHVKNRAKERVALETNTSYGEPMWLSLYAKGGSLKHWAILMHRQKYELRRKRAPPQAATSENADLGTVIALIEETEVHREPIDDVSNSSGFGRYYEKMIREDLSYERTMKARAKAIKTGRRPEVGFHYILHIGWTRKTKEEVDAACLKVEKTFGTYNVISNNCQHFVRRLATKVVDKKSEDWDWLHPQRLSLLLSSKGYDYERPETIGPPGGVAKLCINKLNKLNSMGKTMDPEVLWAVNRQIAALERYLRGLEPTYAFIQKAKRRVDEGSIHYMHPAIVGGGDYYSGDGGGGNGGDGGGGDGGGG